MLMAIDHLVMKCVSGKLIALPWQMAISFE